MADMDAFCRLIVAGLRRRSRLAVFLGPLPRCAVALENLFRAVRICRVRISITRMWPSSSVHHFTRAVTVLSRLAWSSHHSMYSLVNAWNVIAPAPCSISSSASKSFSVLLAQSSALAFLRKVLVAITLPCRLMIALCRSSPDLSVSFAIVAMSVTPSQVVEYPRSNLGLP